ncbi:MAG: aminopeptidase P family protein [Oscillospiraceae bacterium]|jgi:Xaa-Pro aminopeptidase|nr:aminopeptidase P family protein [Oscillospiraceae bacterium]
MRINSIIEFLRTQVEIDACLIFGAANRLYFSGAKTSEGILFINKKEAFLLVDSRYISYCKNVVKNCNVILLKNQEQQINDLAKLGKTKKIEVDISSVDAKKFKQLSLKFSELNLLDSDSLDTKIKNMRALKDKYEQKCIEESQKLIDAGFSYILKQIQPGISEREIAINLEFFLRKHGAEKTAFEFIVVSGLNTALPHGKPSSKQIQAGDLVTLDFGVVYNHYCSDMTRTVAVSKYSQKQKEIYKLVLAAQKSAINAIAPGKSCREIDETARNIIVAAGYGDYFGHGLGHSLGLNIHEEPTLSPQSKEIIQEGNVFTVEPGVYFANQFGVRIEDTIFVTKDGIKNITKSPKEELTII